MLRSGMYSPNGTGCRLMYSLPGPGRRRPEDAGVAPMVRPRPVQDRADQDRDADRAHGVADLVVGGLIRERVDVGGVLGPHDQAGLGDRPGLDLGRELHRLVDMVVEHLPRAILEVEPDVGHVALDQGHRRRAAVAIGGRRERPGQQRSQRHHEDRRRERRERPTIVAGRGRVAPARRPRPRRRR